MAEELGGKGTSFTGKWGTESKTARPRSVGPHHAKHEQEDPADRGVDPERAYKPLPGDNAPNPSASGGPVNIGTKGSGGRPDDAAPDAGVPAETRAKATGRGKADSGSLPEE